MFIIMSMVYFFFSTMTFKMFTLNNPVSSETNWRRILD